MQCRAHICTYVYYFILLGIHTCISLYKRTAVQGLYQCVFRSTYKSTMSCWVQNEVDEVVWCFGSSKIHFLPQSYRSLVLLLPLYNQLTLWYPLTFFKLIDILLGDLKCVSVDEY